MFVKGIGHTKFGNSMKTATVLGYEAAIMALKDANMTLKEINAIVVTDSIIFTNGEHQRHTPAIYSEMFETQIPIIRVVAACAGGGTAFYTANKMNYNNVLVIGADNLKTGSVSNITEELAYAGERFDEQDEGLNFPAQNALIANLYMKESGATDNDLNLVSKKNYDFGKNNPYAAFFNKTVELEKIEKSPIISSPLKLHHCSISVSGAAAIILTKEKTPIEVVGSSLITSPMTFFTRENFTSWDGVKKAATQAYQQANITPDKINCAEVHDAFSSLELMAYEDLGFCAKNHGKDLIRQGETLLTGRIPVNTSGGLKAKGHPISATGVSQIVWLVKQLRGDAGPNQVKNCKYVLAQNSGGVGATVTVNILKRHNL